MGRHDVSLRELDGVNPLFMLPDDPLATDVLIPGFKAAQRVDCMVGFFRSSVLTSLAPGLASYIHDSQHAMRLIISPVLSADDKTAIEDGLRPARDAAMATLEKMLITEDFIQRHTLKCLSWLLQAGRLEVKVAVMPNALFHPKVWLFTQDKDVVAAHGSSNVTLSGLQRNIEQVAISRSWTNSTERYVTDHLRQGFARYWANEDNHCLVVPMSTALRDKLVRTYCPSTPPTETDLQELYRSGPSSQPCRDVAVPGFAIPDWLNYTDVPFMHQGQAVDSWCTTKRGILELATGSGKTFAALICAHRLWQETGKQLLVVIAAPYRPLVAQWCEEVGRFGVTPLNVTLLSAQERGNKLLRLRQRVALNLTRVVVVVASHDTLCDATFARQLSQFTCNRLLIADEVHNLGRNAFKDKPPTWFEYRLGLSATPVRQYDDDGTQALFDFFGPVVYRFGLDEAIGRCLVEYDYFLHVVHLDEDEMDDWYRYTEEIGRNSWRAEETGKPDEVLKRLLIKRRRLLECAKNKMPTLASLLDRENVGQLRHTLVYASDKAPGQLERVNELLLERDIRFHQLTAKETAQRAELLRIMRSFREGDIQVLTSKRVLDEGIDVPEIGRAYILASTTVERQWIQRRGRLLRKSPETSKAHSVVHDLVTVPQRLDRLDQAARGLLDSELQRVQEFARLARNAATGPQPVIDQLVEAAYLAPGK